MPKSYFDFWSETEHGEQRYSGKPDAKRNAQIKCIVESVELIVNSSKRESLAETHKGLTVFSFPLSIFNFQFPKTVVR